MGGAMIEYTVLRSRRRTIALQVTREAQVVVRAPLYAAEADIRHFVLAHEDWLSCQLARQRERLSAHPPRSPEEQEALRRQAKAQLPDMVRHWAQEMGVTPTGLKITSARTRFGSCSGKNSLCFSLYLMQYPPEAIDYVVVHELAHIRHKDHSPAFYAEVSRYLPDYRQRQALLRN